MGRQECGRGVRWAEDGGGGGKAGVRVGSQAGTRSVRVKSVGQAETIF